MATSSAPGRPRTYALLGFALILLATCIAYLPAINGGILWDDDAHLTKPELQSTTGLYRIWFEPGATQQYYPLLHSAFWIEHQLWGDSLRGYHLITLLWHLVSASLVYLILTRLKIPGALLAAAIFALHPVMVESVAWITEQKNTLSAVFYLGAILTYLRFDELRRPAPYFIALALFILGLLTKTVTATLPAALLVIFWWQRDSLSWKRDVLPLVPFFVLGAVAGLITAWVERYMIGAEGAEFSLSFLQRILLAGRVIWFYIAKLVWPQNLMFIYPRWTIDPSQGWQWLYPAAALAATVALFAFRHRSRAPLAGWLFFVGTLFPVLGFLNVYPFIYSYVADHFQYLASLGLIVPAAAAIDYVLNKLSGAQQPLVIGACILLLAILATLTRSQSEMYADSVTLYETTLQQNPECWMAHYNLAHDHERMGRTDEAIEHYRQTININPAYTDAYNNLGRLFLDSGQLPEAVIQFEKALALNPDNALTLNNMGIARDHQGRYQEAIEALEHAIRVQPNHVEAYQNLGNTLMHVGRMPEAIERIEHALKLNPNDAEAQNNMGVVLAQNDKIPQAIEHFRRAVELKPDDAKAHANLGKTLMRAGNNQEAAIQLEQALQLQPNRADLHKSLGELLLEAGHSQRSLEHLTIAVQLDPNDVSAYLSLAKALASLNRTQEATAAAQRGIEVARAAGRESEAKQIEAWLQHK